MKRIKRTVMNIFWIALGLTFLFSCTFFDKQTKKETKEPPSKAPAVSEAAKPRPKAAPPEVKEHPKKAPAAAPEKYPEHKPVPKESGPKTPPESKALSDQQTYYNMGMRYYSQEKYVEAKQAWQKVIKLGRKTALADKARDNIKKVDQILKTLKEMSGR
jgi:cytoskeletal protein RodZ